jgi:hypothetical protein
VKGKEINGQLPIDLGNMWIKKQSCGKIIVKK